MRRNGSGGGGQWGLLAGGLPAVPCDHAHPPVGGTLDETSRRLSHEELAVAESLAAAGHRVVSVAESRSGGRSPDLEVCGRGVEIKSFDSTVARRRPPTAVSVMNKLLDASGQADVVVVHARGSGLTEGAARSGLAMAAATPRGAGLESVAVLGDGFATAWARSRQVALSGARSPRLQPAEPGLTI